MTDIFPSNPLCMAFVQDPETVAALKSVYVEHLNLKMDVRAGGISDATAYLKKNRSPSILILDISASELPVTDIYALGDACEPGVEVIAIGARNDVGLFRQLMGLGVRDYLVKPLTSNLLQKSLESVLGSQSDASTESKAGQAFPGFGKMVSFIGARGGVGVTTLASNCSWILANTHFKRTSIIDMDVQQGMISHFLEVDASSNFKEVLENPERIDEIFAERVMVRQGERLYALSSEDSLSDTVHITQEARDALLDYLLHHFQYVVFDLPRNYQSSATLDTLKKSDTVVIVCDYTITSVRDTARLVKFLVEQQNTNQRILLVANHAGAWRQGEIDQHEFEKAVQRKINATIRFDHSTPLEALNRGVPAATLRGPLSQGLQQVVRLLLDHDLEQQKHEKSSLLEKWFSKK